MKKAEIIASKHVDHIENEKNILEKIQHPFAVSYLSEIHYVVTPIYYSYATMDSSRMNVMCTLQLSYLAVAICSRTTEVWATSILSKLSKKIVYFYFCHYSIVNGP